MRTKIRRYQAHSYKFKTHRSGVGREHVRRAASHPFAVPVATFIGLIFITGILLLVISRKPVTIDPNVVVISHDNEQQIVSSKEPTVGALLKKLALQVNEGDVVEPAVDTPIRQDDFRINIYRAKPVEITDNGQRIFAKSARTTERGVVQQTGLTVYPEDKLTKKPITDFVSGGIGDEIVVDRATPVNVNLYGAPVVMRTHATTVGGLLQERRIRLAAQDQVKPALETPIAAAGQIAVVRNGLSSVTIQEDIAMPTEKVTDNTLSYGVSAVRQKGAVGKKAVTYQINTQNGAEVGRTAIQTTVIQPPVTEILVVGSNLSGIKGDMARAGIAPADYQYADYIIGKESGWNPAARNASSGAYGLCQALPGNKMANVSRGGGPDWETNPVTQLRWCNSYAVSRYGGWQAAYSFWLSHHYW
ncbi:MAG: hypothetical protein JWR85_3944 [Marmoricola sp.]|nr:hypothetical protein [Marmoricola sp.]